MGRREIAVTIGAVCAGTMTALGFGLMGGETRQESTGTIPVTNSPKSTSPQTDLYAAVLKLQVNDIGMVNYAALKANPEDLNAYLSTIANLDADVFTRWAESEQIAFWCNAYNAYTLKAIIDHYPIEASFFGRFRFPKNSIRQIAGVWDTMQWPIMGKRMTLDEIEHKTLRVQFDEPRIHAALVCAAMSCPPLRDEPYDGDRLDAQLDEEMVAFLGDANRFRIDRDKDIVYLSPILKWYGDDFIKSYGVDEGFANHEPVERAVLNAIAPHIDEEDGAYLRSAQYTVKYLDYDWSLNEQ
jgi:hypothetical protein